MAETKFTRIHCPETFGSKEDLVTQEMLNKEDEAELNISGKSAEEAREEENIVKEVQADVAKEEGYAEAVADQQLGPEVTGSGKKASPQEGQPTEVLERQEKAEEAMNYAEPAMSEIEEESELAKELKNKKHTK